MKLIDKDALVAEIERKRGICKKVIWDLRSQENKDYYQGKAEAYKDTLDLLDTLEVKEVDFEEELKCYCNDYYNCDYPKQLEEGNCSEVMPHIVSAAKHFFELGIKAQKGE